MKEKILTAVCCCLICAAHCQSYKGFEFYFNGGLYKGHAYNATYYNGNNNDINIGRVLENNILKNEIDRNIAERSGVILDGKGIYLEELPMKMHYDWSFIFGIGAAYRLTPELSLTATVGQIKMSTTGMAVFGYKKGVIGNQTADYLNFPIIGKEKRNFLEIGLRYTGSGESKFSWYYEFALQLNSVKVENADLVVEGAHYSMIDYYGGAKYDPTITQVEIDPMLGGIGFGGVVGGGLLMKINEWGALSPFAQLHYSRFHLGEYTRLKPNYYFGVRIIVKDYLFA